MVQREQELEQSSVAQRAMALTCIDRRAARHQLHLRVVREVGLPDTATEVCILSLSQSVCLPLSLSIYVFLNFNI